MSTRNRRDFAGGLLLAVTGGAIFFHAVASYDLGSFRSMGPGMGLGLGRRSHDATHE